MISLPFPSMTVASLHTVGHGCRVPLLYQTLQKEPCDSKGYTHTHTRLPSGITLRSRQEGGLGREEKKEKEGGKGKEGVPSYNTSVQGHTKRRREGFPAMTNMSRDTQARRKGEKGKRKRERERFSATRKRPGTHQGEGCT